MNLLFFDRYKNHSNHLFQNKILMVQKWFNL